jgi:hypothetical protein
VRKFLVLLIASPTVFLASCHSSGGGVLESGVARVPDDAGIVTDATLERIQLDHKRNYALDPKVESFTTRNHNIQSLLSWPGKFVQIGLTKSRKIIWIAGIGTVVQGPTPTVYYSGIVTRHDASRHRVYFDDGTVLTTEDAVHVPPKGQQVVCSIDPSNGLVTKLTPA